MSLEAQMKALTEAVERNTEALLQQGGTSPADDQDDAPKAKAKPKAKSKTPAKSKAKPKAKAKAAKKSKFTRQQVANKVLGLANKFGREHAKEVMGELKAKTVKDLKEEDFDKCVELLDAKMKELAAEAEEAEGEEEDFEDEEAEEDFDEEDEEDEEDFDD